MSESVTTPMSGRRGRARVLAAAASLALACGTGPADPPDDDAGPIDPPTGRFQPIGPPAVYAWHIAYAPDDSSRIYLGLDDGGGVWASDDAGRSFALATGPLPDVFAQAFALDGRRPERVYAGDGAGRGVFLSRDRGATWRFANDGLNGFEEREITALAIDPASVDTVWAATQGGLRVSRDAGETWERVAGPIEAVPLLELVAAVGGDGTTHLFAATGGQDETDPQAAARLYRSVDGGDRFEDVTALLVDAGAARDGDALDRPIRELKVDRRGRLLVGFGMGPDGSAGRLFRSDPDRRAFAALPLEIASLFVAVAEPPGAGDVLHVTGDLDLDPALYVSTDDGASFAGVGDASAEATLPLSLTVDPGDPRHLWMGTYSELLESKDGGATWANSTGGITHSCGSAIAVTERDGEAIVDLGLIDHNGLLARRNAFRREGNAWRELPVPSDVLSLTSPGPDRIVVGTLGRGALHSDDGGRSFDASRGISREETHVLSLFTTATGELLAGASGPAGAGLYRSRDGGASFARAPDVDLVPVQFAQAGDVVVAAAIGGVLRSGDGGETWTAAFESDDDLRSIAIVDGHGDELLLGDADGRIRRSTDRGATFEVLHEAFVGRAEVNRILVDPRDGSILVGLGSANVFVRSVERDSGLWRSTDGGRTFVEVARATPSSHIYDLAWDPTRPGRLFAAMWCSGVQVLDLPVAEP